ncbi:hypothetical protein [Streptomyces sp. NBC_01304]|uniref:hypothetical protein n=1 Tax=Streptomyces sp. NBC_01304 TaxID=2903818 RepID=UPI002E15FC36|nr:hypothetical protein OG430_48615 [Streptomyces sp. NBC_01304]
MASVPSTPRTEGDVMSAALASHGFPSFLNEEGGIVYLAVPVDPETKDAEILLHPHIKIASGEDADRRVDEHDAPWVASLYGADLEFVDTIYGGDETLGIEDDSRACAEAVVTHAAWWRAGTLPAPVPAPAERLVNAIRQAGPGAFYDAEDGVVIAHRGDVAQELAVTGAHLVLQLHRASDGWSDGFTVTAWAPGLRGDLSEVAQVFACRGLLSDELVERGARAVSEWLSEPRPSAGALLLAALAEQGIVPVRSGSSYVVPLLPGVTGEAVWSSEYLRISGQSWAGDHVPAAHIGWAISRHPNPDHANGNPVCATVYPTPLYPARGECATDSANTAAYVADRLATASH